MGEASPLDGAREVLAEAAEGIDRLRGLYDKSIRDNALPPGIRPKVKSILEHQRSALDYLAHELVRHFGRGGVEELLPDGPDDGQDHGIH